MERIIILGAGGHSKVIIDLIQCCGKYRIEGIIDCKVESMNSLGVPIIGDDLELNRIFKESTRYAFIAIGDINIRRKVYNTLKGIGYKLPILFHYTSFVSRYTNIGEGTCVLANAIVNVDTVIGENCIINSGAIVEHDCVIGFNTHISPGVKLGGCVVIGDNTHIGIGATIMPGKKIGDNVIIGAGAVVIDNIPDNTVCVGVPAKIIRYK